ncbi:hypothetical protein B0H67DRAFT_599857 [Lasiosphaeris hirsuta]|uniref:Phosphoinositide phospholipase C n=1 Tax=Lasiosphaeris hirsuta TaxID=260670 RepID=A0AA40AQW6_9PEZI|nr:hypothetical protein B0H67DRAFT_599857 [Lasiosphaeris hirsuta]
MASDSMPPRRPRPSNVWTNLPRSQLIAIPQSAMSSSTVSPDSQHGSPTLSIEPAGSYAPAGSTVQGSPEMLEPFPTTKGLDDMDLSLPLFQLPEPITPAPISASMLSRSPGATAMGEAMKSLTRRSSNSFRRVHSLVARRQSSTNPSRDGSVGPGILRRRGSTSNPNLALEHTSPFLTDDDDECAIEKDDSGSLCSGDGPSRELSLLSTTTSGGSSSRSGMTTGPVIPSALSQGTSMIKVGKKKNMKRITLCYDQVATKIFWDKSRSSKAIYIDDIREIRTAEDIGQYRLDSGLDSSSESRFFSILYTRPGHAATKTLHVVADDEKSFRTWTEVLEAICKHRQAFATSLMAFNDKAISRWWRSEVTKLTKDDKTRSRSLSLSLGEGKPDLLSVEHICRSLHIHVPTEDLRGRVEAVKSRTGSPDKLDFAGFLDFVRLMKARKDIRSVYRRHAENPECGMTRAEFLHFLRDVQRENVDGDLATFENAFVCFARNGRSRDVDKLLGDGDDGLLLSEPGLAGYLASGLNSAIVKAPSDTYELDRPLSEYYISSSHNTYLLGRQVAGISSIEGYISALVRGCRCVEIDCWDGADDQPVVMHGHTLTTRISFLEVIKTINKYAFFKTHFPLWISLEVRCSLATQANMTKIMIDVFGDKLVRAPLDTSSDRLPSPSDLKDRILIKVKQSQPLEEPVKNTDRFGRRRGNSQPSPYQRPLSSDNLPGPSSPALGPTPPSRSSTRQISPSPCNIIVEGEVHDTPSSSPSECESESEKDSAKRISSKINPVLGELGVYCVGIQFDGFESTEAKKFNHIFSFKERTFAEKSQPGEGKRALYRHNMRYMMRVYPNGNRITSSNFDPLVYWKRGVQMAALNWQTYDTGMQLNQAMFDGGTDQSGYVLKPVEGREILQIDQKAEKAVESGKRPRKRVAFKVEVISAQQLMKPFNLGEKRTMDPYVEVEVLLADDMRNKTGAAPINPDQDTPLKYRTKIVPQNGFNPEFNETFSFNLTTKYPDLIFVRWSVKLADKFDRTPPIATFTAKLSSLNQGYRTIPLFNQYGERYLFSTLFCQIKKEKIHDIMVKFPEDTPKNGSKLKSIGRTVFNQSNLSPKSSMDSGFS